MMHVGVLSMPVLTALEDWGILPQSAVISMGDVDITHALRIGKQERGQAMPAAFVRNIPELLLKPDAVYLQADKIKPMLWFVYETDKGKFLLQIDKTDKKSKEKMNIIRTAGKIFNWNSSLKQHILLWGKELAERDY